MYPWCLNSNSQHTLPTTGQRKIARCSKKRKINSTPLARHCRTRLQCSTRREGIIVCLTFCLISLELFVLELWFIYHFDPLSLPNLMLHKASCQMTLTWQKCQRQAAIRKNTLGSESQGLPVVKLCYRWIEAFTSDAYLLAAGLVPISATSAAESKSWPFTTSLTLGTGIPVLLVVKL